MDGSKKLTKSEMERAKRNQAREKLQQSRTAAKTNRLDDHEFEEEDDVFDMVDEEEYAKIVHERNESNDFVVDDDGIGYKDDGEEHLGIVEDPYEAKKRKLLEESEREDRKSNSKFKKLAPTQKKGIDAFLRSGHSAARPVFHEPAAAALDVDSLISGVASKDRAPTAHHASRRHIALAPFRSVPAPRLATDGGMSSGRAGWNESEAEGVFLDTSVALEEDTYNAMTSSDAIPEDVKSDEIKAAKISFSKTTKVFKKTLSASDTFKPDLLDLDDITPSFAGEDAGVIMGDSISASSNSLLPIDPALWIQTTSPSAQDDAVVGDGDLTERKPEEFLNMYWLDATEVHGVLYLFGKVAVTENNITRYVSCCVAVNGCERNLFVLAKPTGELKADGSAVRAGLAEVHQELTRILVPSVIPRSEGSAFRCKKVRRKYAFEHKDIPREETEYLKVVYSARYSVPSTAQCNGTQCIERIFGTTSSALELFILKRQLLGPCWITIRNPKTISDPISWCKIELGIENPKYVTKCKDPPAVPPLAAMCISLKTAVNPVTHTHEVIAISCLTHTSIDIEADTEMTPKCFRRFTLVRPLGPSCGVAYTQTFPHDLQAELLRAGGTISTLPNERALLNTFFQRLGVEDPDILASHNLFGFEFDVIINRAVAHKLAGNSWSKLGRLRRSMIPKSISDRDFCAGRVLCDTYKSAKEFLRETTYSLSHLAYSQLGSDRKEVDPVDVPKYFSCSLDIIKLLLHTVNDAWLVMKLMIKLQVIPLTKQLTNYSGNLWSRTMRGARAERIEYLLLHEFHTAKYVLPEKKPMENNKKNASKVHAHQGGDGEEDEGKVGGVSRSRAKAAYAGGLVLEPKKGLYDTYVLLLDFNSLYPSIIQEYNLCFTTINWTNYMEDAAAVAAKAIAAAKKKPALLNDDDADANEEDAEDADTALITNSLPPLPDSSAANGILPRVIRNLVEKRKQVKSLLKKEQDPVKKQVYDIRQKALKLTANSMYGCLGFTFSRFYARPIAALVTAMGREALQRTVTLATNQMQLNVIYGDTDSVMIDTGSTDLAAVKEIGVNVRKEVNKLYKCLELDIDGIFKSMLLLKKKKYAAVTINERADGSTYLEKEMKGLDLVRRDWCPLSKDAGKFVVEEILSGHPREEIVENVHAFIVELSRRARAGEEDLIRFVVTKGLNKNPKDYPDLKGQAHLQVALRMIEANKPVNIGDHIPYVICKEGEPGAPPAQRAHHPDEIRRSNGELSVDVEWYLDNQILPPISRLCEPIEGTSVAILSTLMGLDSSKYANRKTDDNAEEEWGFIPRSQIDDSIRFAKCEKLMCKCPVCKVESAFSGVLNASSESSGLSCVSCGAMNYGRATPRDCFIYLSNRITIIVRSHIKKYYDAWLVCDDHTCGCRTRQQSVVGNICIMNCHGRLVPEYDAEMLHTQLKYIETLFDVERYKQKHPTAIGLTTVSVEQLQLFSLLKQHMNNAINGSAYNWVLPGLWSTVFGGLVKHESSPRSHRELHN